MVLPCACPRCGEDIIIDMNLPYPTIDVLAPADVSDEIKNVIENHDNTESPEAA